MKVLYVCLPQAVRLEALHRFTVLWHLTREIQTNRTMSLSRSFDRLVHRTEIVDGLVINGLEIGASSKVD